MGRPRINPLTIDKICPVCNKTYTIPYDLRKRRVYCSKSCANHDPKVIKKMIESQTKTFNEKYGGHPMNTENTVKKFKESVFRNHGDDYYTNYLVKESKKTLLEKYGDENYNNMEKSKETCLERYGVENYTQTEEYKLKSEKTCLEKYGVRNYSQCQESKLNHYKNMFDKFNMDQDFKNFEPQFTIEEYKGVTHDINRYKFKCKRCNNIDLYHIGDGLFPLCVNCDKLNSSLKQKEIYDFLRSILGNHIHISLNDRITIYPKEIDIYIPSLKLGIEFDGLYWHGECSGNKNKVYHINKFKNCMLQGINLITIFENEWNFKKEIIKSILKNLVGKITNRIYARDCEIRELSYTDSSLFLEKNHIQGTDKPSIKMGLFHKNELVSVMTFCKSRFDKNYEYEMSRYCNQFDKVVIGGASKLFSYFMNVYKPKSIVSYSDRRYFNGDLYNKLGFKFLKNTDPNYYYIINKYKNIVNRMSFQKHKLKKLLLIFDENISEWENMKNNGFDRIWDCGNSKWVLTTKYDG